MVEEKRAPAAVEAHVQDVEEEGGDDGAQEGDGHEGVARHLGRFAGAAKDACREEGVGFGEADDGHEDHDDGCDFHRRGVVGVEGEDVVSKENRSGADDGREEEAPLDAAALVRFPVFLAAFAAGLAGHDHAGLAEAGDEVVVHVADIHADAVDREGDGAKAGGHAAEEDHADAFAALFGKDAAQDGHDGFEIFPVRNVGAALEKLFLFQNPRGPDESEEGAHQGADGGAGDAHGRYGAVAENEERIESDVHDVAAHIRLHDDAGSSVAKLHGLENQRKRRDIDGSKPDGAIRHGLGHVVIVGAQEIINILQEEIKNQMKDAHEDGAEEQ